MRCYQCKKELPEGASYCPHCGADQQFSEQLVRSAAKDREAFKKLYDMTKDNVYYTIKALISDEEMVRDLVQDTYVRAIKSLPKLKEAVAFRGWIKRIARNLAIDALRHDRSALFSELIPADSEDVPEFRDERIESMPEQVMDQKETTRLIGEILDKLPEEQRLAIVMHYMQQMSIKEIAETFQVSENTVKSRLSYGRKKVEMEVLALEKKGTKLYGLAPIPFLLWLFANQEANAAALPDAQIVQAVTAQVLQGGAAAGAGVGLLAQGVAAKVIAAVAAVVLGVGGLTWYIVDKKHRSEVSAAPSSSIVSEEPTKQMSSSVISEAIAPEENSAIEASTVSEADVHAAYQAILDEYAAVFTMDDETYLNDPLSYRGNTQMTSFLWYYHYFGKEGLDPKERSPQWYYAYADLDGNGVDELLIATGWPPGPASVNIENIFYFDGSSARRIWEVPEHLLYGVSAYYTFEIYDNGLITYSWSPGDDATLFSDGVIRLSDAGAEVVYWSECEASWDASDNFSLHFYNDDGDLTREQIDSAYAELGVVYEQRHLDFDWQELKFGE